MPKILKEADRLSEELSQDILVVDFRKGVFGLLDLRTHSFDKKLRSLFLNWIKQHPHIRFEEVYPPLPSGLLAWPYPGTIAVVACQTKQPGIYSLVVQEWENADGTPKHPPLLLYVLKKDFRANRTDIEDESGGNLDDQ